jgi:hypothetical protein
MTVEATGAYGAAANFTVSATDAVDGPVAATAIPASGSQFPLGTTTVTVTAKDKAGNTATKTFTITVRDTTGPAISAMDHYHISATGPAGALVTAGMLGITATDKVDGVVALTYTPALPFTFSLGSPSLTLLTLRAEDSRHNATVTTTKIYVTYAWDKWVEPSKDYYRSGETVKVAFKIQHPGSTPKVTTALAKLTVTASGNVKKINAQPFTYNAASDEYRFMVGTVYGLNTTGWAKGNYTLSVDLGDGVSHTTTLTLR